ncbi:hypothetical protein H5410_013329 [Solanum commersonii]|uniref:MBD domain-containing protein n=1 Tax=Solanum commersonii TaxID=4109 RepID=A0A9J6AVE8_SOLCO|nr:hypothetical protein H5410_013329 [Solanum commersonii]
MSTDRYLVSSDCPIPLRVGSMDQNVVHDFEPVNIMKPLTAPGAFAVQCARCFKWRYIPTKEKYEEIREHILERPFYYESGLKWAIDVPNIPQPPPGCERLIKFRTKGGIRLADDVYYDSPSGKRLTPKMKLKIFLPRYLEQYPEDATQSVKLKKFSFQTPRPLEEDYVKKRCPAPSHNINGAYDEVFGENGEERKKKAKLWEKKLQEDNINLQRERDRKTARIAIESIKRTLDFDNGQQAGRDFFPIIGAHNSQ